MISGLMLNEVYRETIELYAQMKEEKIAPTELTYTHLLTACGKMRDIAMGKMIHEEIVNDNRVKMTEGLQVTICGHTYNSDHYNSVVQILA
jgi:pentatricopeptide repeat protein